MPVTCSLKKVLSLPVEAGAQILEGDAAKGGQLEVFEHACQDTAAAEFDPLLHPHLCERLDDPDPAHRGDHLLLERSLDGFGLREHRAVHGTDYRHLWHMELHGIEDPRI